MTTSETPDNRRPIWDPIWGYVIEEARKWGTDATYGAPGEHPSDQLWDLAAYSEMRDKFERIALDVIRQHADLGLTMVKWGGSPGGEPFCETVIRKARPNGSGGWLPDHTYIVSFGVCEDWGDGERVVGTQWYIQRMPDGPGQEFDETYYYLSWIDATPERIGAYVMHLIREVRGY